MKTTIDLPADLVRQLKLRAVHEGRKFKDIAAESLRRGLAAPAKSKKQMRPLIVKDKKTGLSVVRATLPVPRDRDLTPDQIDDILLQQEVDWVRESS